MMTPTSSSPQESASDLTDPEAWWQVYGAAYEGRTWLHYRNLLSEAIRHMEAPPLVDIGAGCGFLVECARRFGITSKGLEASKHALSIAQKLHPQANMELWVSGNPLPMPSSTVGGVVLNEFIDHISVEDNDHLFREIHRVLMPGGVVLVKSPSRHNHFDEDEGHISFFSPGEFASFVSSRGFQVIEQPYSTYPVFGTSRLGTVALRIASRFVRPEKWAARIDLDCKKA